jgi:hypothetical protein
LSDSAAWRDLTSALKGDVVHNGHNTQAQNTLKGDVAHNGHNTHAQNTLSTTDDHMFLHTHITCQMTDIDTSHRTIAANTCLPTGTEVFYKWHNWVDT